MDPLDELLAKARWPHPPAESTQRLRQQWVDLRIKSHSLWNWSRIAVAAAVLIAVGLRLMPKSERAPISAVAPISLAASIPQIDRGRPATQLELAILRLQPAQHKAARVQPPGVPLVPLLTGWPIPVSPPPPVNAVADPKKLVQAIRTGKPAQRDRALAELLALGPARAGKPFLNLLADDSTAVSTTAAVCRNPTAWIDTLFAALNDPHISVRTSAAAALAQIDGPAITSRLIVMADNNEQPREAVAALVQIHSPSARQFVAAAMQSPSLACFVRSAMAQDSSTPIQTGVLQ